MKFLLLPIFLLVITSVHAQCYTSIFQNALEDEYAYSIKENLGISGPVKSLVERTSRIHQVSCDSTFDELEGLIVNHYRDSGKLVYLSNTKYYFSETGNLLSRIDGGHNYSDKVALTYEDDKLIRFSDFANIQVITYDSNHRISARTITPRIQHPKFKNTGWQYYYVYSDDKLLERNEKSKIIRQYNYDSLGRVISIRDVQRNPLTVYFEYDEKGRKISETVIEDDSLTYMKQLTFIYGDEGIQEKVYTEYDKHTLKPYRTHSCHYTNGKLSGCEWNAYGHQVLYTYRLDDHFNWIEQRYKSDDYEYIVTRKIIYFD